MGRRKNGLIGRRFRALQGGGREEEEREREGTIQSQKALSYLLHDSGLVVRCLHGSDIDTRSYSKWLGPKSVLEGQGGNSCVSGC